MSSVKEFFDEERNNYGARYDNMSRVFRSAAEVIAAKVSGRTFCVGGIWPGALPGSTPADLTIADLSPGMLSLWCEYDAKLISADARNLPIEDGTIDTIVYPMMLHHICDGTAKGARLGVRETFVEAHRVLTPGGRLVLFDYSVSRWVYAIELALSGVTRRLLELKGIPLVVMHAASFYEDALTAAGFSDVENVSIEGDRRSPFEMIKPIIGIPWFTIPRVAYPVSPLLLTARR